MKPFKDLNYEKYAKIEEFGSELKEIKLFILQDKVIENKNIIYNIIDSFLFYIGTYCHSFENTPGYKKLIKLYRDENIRGNAGKIVLICEGLLNNIKISL